MMTDVEPGPDAEFLERFHTSIDHNAEESQRDDGWRVFLCRQHCHGNLVVDTTKKNHYQVLLY